MAFGGMDALVFLWFVGFISIGGMPRFSFLAWPQFDLVFLQYFLLPAYSSGFSSVLFLSVSL